APSNSNSDLFAAVDAAVAAGANIVSMSFSGPEYSTELADDAHFNVPGVIFVAATGDNGNFGGQPYPASSPHVVAVGGTELILDPNTQNYSYELAWEDSGGGISALEP